jgi:CubicO group peptidase (beta-lactamase class C family)
MIGMALKEGQIKSIYDPVADYLPEFKVGPKDEIKLFHLMSMTSGLKWVESEKNALSDNARAYYGKDLTGLIRSLKTKSKPGKTFEYLSGATQLLADVFKMAVGQSVGQYANERLWPLIQAEENAYWNLDRKHGVEKAFCCFYAIPKDFARIGQLFLNKGIWNGEALLEPDFIDLCLTPLPVFDPLSGQLNQNYGLHWWLASYSGNDYFYARGIRGQYIICNKESNSIIVRTGRKRNPVKYPFRHPPDLFDHINAGMEILHSIPH